MTTAESSDVREREWQRQKIDRYKKQYGNLVEHAKDFLAGRAEFDLAILKEGIEAERFLSYNDEDGSVVENDELYEAGKTIKCSPALLRQIYDVDEKLYDVYSSIGGHAAFMRGPYRDMSHTVPLNIKREMIAAQIEALKRFDTLVPQVARRKDKTQDSDGKMAALKAENYAQFRAISLKGRPYTAADITVAINHADQYRQLRKEFLRVGGTDLNMVGEYASLTTRRILTDMYPDEYAAELAKYSVDKNLAPDLDKRNAWVQSSDAIDEEFAKANRSA